VDDGRRWRLLGLGGVVVAVLAVVALLGGELEEAWHPTGPVINEVVASNGSTLADEDGDFSDWIELHNPTDEPVSLAGYHLSDDPEDPARWAFPDLTLDAGGYLVVFASGKDRRDPGGELHTDFAVAQDGEPILLTGPEVGLADRFPPVELPRDASYGRDPTRPSRLCYFAFPSPGGRNADGCFDEPTLGRPEFTVTSGFYDAPVEVEIEAAGDGPILYTLDGSYPDPDGNAEATRVYDGPLTIADRSDDPDVFASIPTAFAFDGSIHGDGWRPPDGPVPKATVVRARTPHGRETVQTYFVGEHLQRDGFPVVSIASDADHLFDDEVGIYVPGRRYADYVASEDHDPDHGWAVPANPRERGRGWERPPQDDLRRAVHLTWCEPDGSCPYSRDVGIRIHGGYTRVLPQKTLRLYARNDYGDRIFRYPFFGEDAPDDHRRLLLRNGGNTWGLSLFADALFQGFVDHLASLDVQAFRPTVVHLNGEYWGIHNLRERYDPHYLEATYGVATDRVAILGSRLSLEHGTEADVDHFRETLELLDTGGAVDDATVATVGERLALDSLMDYLALEVFASNADWPHNNVRLWRSLDADGADGTPTDGRWRFLVFDLDMIGGSSYDHQVTHDNLARLELDPDEPFAGSGIPWLLQRLTTNPGFRDAFVARFVDHLNSTFASARTVPELDALEALYATEMPRHIARWRYPATLADWEAQVDLLRTYLRERPAEQFRQLARHLDVGEPVRLRVRGSGEDGVVHVGGVRLRAGELGVDRPDDWTGTVLSEVAVRLRAEPADGRRFVRWEGLPDGVDVTSDDVEVTLPADTTIRAVWAER
jgi:hypothetical protein